MKNGFTHDFNIHQNDIVQHPKTSKLFIFIVTKAIPVLMMKRLLWHKSLKTGKKGVFVAGFSANSENDAAMVLIDLAVKKRH